MSKSKDPELTARVIRYFRSGRITEEELFSQIFDKIADGSWDDSASALTETERGKLWEYLEFGSRPETIHVFFGSWVGDKAPVPSRNDKLKIRQWLEEHK